MIWRFEKNFNTALALMRGVSSCSYRDGSKEHLGDRKRMVTMQDWRRFEKKKIPLLTMNSSLTLSLVISAQIDGGQG
jgi:hypothetical protein